MEYQRKRQLILKVVNRELKQYLKAYDKNHPHYKRNIRNLYEGLNDLGILTDIPNAQNFKQFKEAFSKADKGLKQALLVAYVYEDVSLSHYFSHQGKPLNRIKMIGNVFVSQIVNRRLDENALLDYQIKTQERERIIKDKQDVKEMLQGLKEDKKYLEKQLKETQKELKALYKDFSKKIKLEAKDTKSLLVEQKLTTKLLEKYEPLLKNILRSHGLPEGDRVSSDTNYTYSNLSQAIENRLLDTLKELSKLEIKNERDIEQYEVLSREAIKDVKLKADVDNARLKWLGEKIRLVQDEVHTKANTKVKEAIPNVVKGLTDIINLEKQLHNLLNYIDNKRMSLNDPWRIMGFGSGGVDKRASRAKAISSLAIQVGVSVDHAEKTLGDTREGFWKRDFTSLAHQLNKYQKQLEIYHELIPSGNLKTNLAQTLINIQDLTTKFLEPLFDPEHVVRDSMGHILNIEEHEGVMKMYKEIQGYMAESIKGIRNTIISSREAVEYNENLIVEAKANKKSAMKQLLELNRAQKDIDKLKLRREIRENQENTKKEEVKRDANGLIDGLYALE